MPLYLTSQEKKVLGFIAVMVVLGLAMLGVKKFSAKTQKMEDRAVSTAPAVEKK